MDDFSLRTRLVFGFGAEDDEEELDVTAQLSGIELLLLLLAAGRDG